MPGCASASPCARRPNAPELHDDNIELNVSLLDQRYLAGDAAVYGALLAKLPRFVHGQRDSSGAASFADDARPPREVSTTRSITWSRTSRKLPAGCAICNWSRGWRRSQARRRSRSRRRRPLPELEEARRFLFALRGYLHQHAKRDSNVLTFDAQEWVAEQTGMREPDALMRDYFRNARAVHRSALRVLETEEARASSLFAQFRDRRSRLSNADFTVSRERVYFRAPQQLDADPELLLRLLQFVARHGIRLSLEAEQRIAARLPAIRSLLRVVRAPSGRPSARRCRCRTHPWRCAPRTRPACSRALFPEMEQIDCLVIRDFYHRYTVDEHTLVAIQTLDAAARTRKIRARGRMPTCYSEIEQPGLLVFALLFHDVGKGNPGEGHVDASLRLAERAMERIQMPEAERETVRFLIRCHLEMSATMNGRDPFDPATAEYLAHKVGTVERLKHLTLLTYADISAVNPSAMTSWRAEQLWQLYLLTYNELTRELETERIERGRFAGAQRISEGVSHALSAHALRPRRSSGTCSSSWTSRESGVAVEIEKTGSAYRLTLVTGDRPFLFASVAGTLSSFGMNILKAEAFANRRGTVLDTFSFADPVRTLELNPTEVDRLKATVERAVLGRADVKQLLRSRPRAGAAQPQGAHRYHRFRSTMGLREAATLIQVVAEDRPGLLYDIASTISSHEASIEVVLIDTEAHKAIDVFYVTASGRKLGAEKQRELQAALLATLKG